MPKYQVLKTEIGTCWAKNDHEAQELANEAFFDAPEATYTITDITPRHQLRQIENFLMVMGFETYYDDSKNNICDILFVDIAGRVDMKTSDANEHRYSVNMILDDRERFDGDGYTLYADDHTVEWALPNSTPLVIAGAIHGFITEHEQKHPLTVKPEMIADLGEIADTLTRMGYKAMIEPQDWRGMPAYLQIGETVGWYADGNPYEMPCFTLYYNLNENEDGIAGTGYHLSHEDDESQIVSEIGNESALRVVAEIIKGMARAEYQLENGFN